MNNLSIESLDYGACEQAEKKWNAVAHPLHSLGMLEDAVVRMAGIFGTPDFDLKKKCTLVMCADNGIVAQGISQSGPDITRVVATEMGRNRSSVCIFSRTVGFDVITYDVGMLGEDTPPNVHACKVRQGTRDFSVEPAMTPQEVSAAIEVGINAVKDAVDQGYQIIATGEMGIGNTTTSSAIISALLEVDPAVVTGKGAGLSSEGISRKVHVIEQALVHFDLKSTDVFDVLAKVGGLDIAALVGVFIGSAHYRVPVCIDGIISSVAALVAQRLYPQTRDFMFATHMSHEPAAVMVMDALDLSPLIHAELCLGEGTGAVLAFPLFDAALALYNGMSSFDQLEMESYVDLS